MNSSGDSRSAAWESLTRAVAELDRALALIDREAGVVPAILSARSFVVLACDKLGGGRATEALPRPTLEAVPKRETP